MSKENENFEAAVAAVKSLKSDLEKATAEVRTFANKAEAEIKAIGKVSEETKLGADKALSAVGEKVGTLSEQLAEAEKKADARFFDIEQKLSRRGEGFDHVVEKSLGQQVVEHESVKGIKSTSRGVNAHVTVEKKTTMTTGTGTVGSGASPTTSLVVADRQGMVGLPVRRMVVRDLISPGATTSGNIEYPVETGGPVVDTAASVVTEGSAKPYTNLTFDLKSAPVRTIAVLMKASRQILDDAPQLQSFIDERMPVLLAYTEEKELLKGDGTGQHLNGLVTQATAYSGAFSISGEQAIDRLRLAALQAANALYPSTGYVLHPNDWAKIETLKDGFSRYLIGDPQGVTLPRLWGLPVVPTLAMTSGHFLTGAFKLGAQLFDRMTVEVLISTENSDDFEKNLITIRGEERVALAVYRPTAFIYGSLP